MNPLPALGDAALRDLTPLSLQTYVSGMANGKLSFESPTKRYPSLRARTPRRIAKLVKHAPYILNLDSPSNASRNCSPGNVEATLNVLSSPITVAISVKRARRPSDLTSLHLPCGPNSFMWSGP